MLAEHDRKAEPHRPAGGPERSGFQKKSLLLFLVAAVFVLGIGAVLIGGVGSPDARGRPDERPPTAISEEQARRADLSAGGRMPGDLQVHLAIVTAALLLGLAVAMTAFLRGVARPIDELAAAAERIAGGRLDTAAPAASPGEIGRIAARFNDLAMNLQEILLLTWHHTGRQREGLNRLSAALQRPPGDALTEECRTTVAVLNRQIDELRETIEAFDFYDVRLSDTAVLAARDGEPPAAS